MGEYSLAALNMNQRKLILFVWTLHFHWLKCLITHSNDFSFSCLNLSQPYKDYICIATENTDSQCFPKNVVNPS